MAPSDKEMLVEMGFPAERVDVALRITKNAGLQPAIDWLAEHMDDPLPTASPSTDTAAETAPSVAGEEADHAGEPGSLKCDDCGKVLRDGAAAQAHATRSGHTNFSESTEVIAPLTAEEKAQKLLELQERMRLKREERKLVEAEEAKAKERMRRTNGQEMVAIKERMEQEEMRKHLDAKKREKEEDRVARNKIKAQIEADRRERELQAEERRRAARGEPASASSAVAAPPATVAAAPAPAKDYDEARLQIRMPRGPAVTHSFPASAQLQSVYEFLANHRPGAPFKLVQPFPRKVLDGADRTKSLKDLGLVPSAALILQ